MQYKTIILALLQQRPQMHEQLRQERKLLTTLEMYAHQLRESHQDWMEHLRRTRPASPNQIRSEALELALRDLEDRLPPVSPAETHLSLEEAVRFITSHTSHE
jgi:hypothetical protein